jgi:hypothetical protein
LLIAKPEGHKRGKLLTCFGQSIAKNGDSLEKKPVVAGVYDALDSDVYTRNAIMLGIANLSAVSEMIRKEHAPNASLEAVRAAVRRYVSQMEEEGHHGEGLHRVLSGTEFSIKSNVSVIQAYPDRRVRRALRDTFEDMGLEFNIISSGHAVTIITGGAKAKETIRMLGKENIISHKEGLHAVYLSSGKGIKTTPGFVAFISSLFLGKGINIVEFYSCYTDTVLIVSKEDSVRAYELLGKVLGKTG